MRIVSMLSVSLIVAGLALGSAAHAVPKGGTTGSGGGTSDGPRETGPKGGGSGTSDPETKPAPEKPTTRGVTMSGATVKF